MIPGAAGAELAADLVRVQAEQLPGAGGGAASSRRQMGGGAPATEPPAGTRRRKPVESRPVAENQSERADPEGRFAKARRPSGRKAMKKHQAGGTRPKARRRKRRELIFGKIGQEKPIPMSDLELDMGIVVVEGDVFAVDHRELKKRGAWVVRFDITDYTGSIRVNKFLGGRGQAHLDGASKRGSASRSRAG
ncbi:MAG: hypothetical protein V8S34_07080 [Lawsonibacter sp.]